MYTNLEKTEKSKNKTFGIWKKTSALAKESRKVKYSGHIMWRHGTNIKKHNCHDTKLEAYNTEDLSWAGRLNYTVSQKNCASVILWITPWNIGRI